MAEESDDAAEKSHEPTERKLSEARRKGNLPRSVDLTTAFAYAGWIAAALSAGAWSFNAMAGTLTGIIARAATPGEPTRLNETLPTLLGPFLIWLLLPASFAALAVTVQRAWVFPPDKIGPKLSRVSPLSNAKQKFGREGLFEFAKSTVKLVAACLILGVFLWGRAEEIAAAAILPAPGVIDYLFESIEGFVWIIFAMALAVGAVDLLWQRAQHIRSNRMSRKELTDEQKDSEGDPATKAARRRKAEEIAMNRMLGDVPGADVVVVNPTHFAVALKWERGEGRAPRVIAKGQDEIAAAIRRTAAEAGVPVWRDPPTARALYATVRLGATIEPEHYKAVAAAIRFADRMRVKARGRQ